MGVACGISLLFYIVGEIGYCVISKELPIMATIFDLPLTPILESVQTSFAVLVNLENLGVAFGISLLSCIQAEIKVFQGKRPPS